MRMKQKKAPWRSTGCLRKGLGRTWHSTCIRKVGEGSDPPSWAQLWGRVLLSPLLSPGLAGPLRWLENCLRRVAEDREEDGEWSGGRLRGLWGWGSR